MPVPSASTPVIALFLALPAGAQMPEGVPVERTMRIPPGALLDLDTGVLLPQREHRPFHADLEFDRDGRGFFVAAARGAMPARADEAEPAGDWSMERLRLGSRQQEPRTFFVRTDLGSVARVTMSVADPYSTASAVVQYVLAPPARAVFLPPPEDLRAAWRGNVLEVTWSGDPERYLVEVETGGQVRKTTCGARRIRLEDLAPEGHHRIRVRGLTADRDVTLPAEVVQWGPHRVPKRGVIEYPDRWYDRTGGVSLQRGEATEEDADVVLYLYGVYVPGGGVQKVGEGAHSYRGLSELPERGYLPGHGRLDEDDVLAVRLRDGRYGKLWLEATDGRDLRSGMRVHFAFLGDGRRHLLAAPEGLACEMVAGGAQVSWTAVDGAEGYRVFEPGKARPVETKGPSILLPGLAADRLHRLRVQAFGPDGEVSDELEGEVSTFGAGYRLGTFRLDASRNGGYGFAEDAAVAHVPGAPFAKGLDLCITGSAGGASWLRFAAPYGIAPAGELSFGEFPDPATAPTFSQEYASDDRDPGADRFLVRTGDGALVSVRIQKRDYPVVRLEYVLRLPAR